MNIRLQKSLFLKALEIESPEAQQAFVEQECDGNEVLINSVMSLLKQHECQTNPIDQPIAVSALQEQTVEAHKPGALIGNYKLLEQIGEGGFGLVFVAEQQEPVRRRVALKIIKPGMATREVIARFEAERQALAIMNHQNIAQIMDGGVTESGHPFFVMELVRGVPLIEFSDNHQLDTVERLELFITVCQAVQHAHQKGIIHRDLKPSNILVTLQDGRAVAKVIDFGVAKAIGQSLTQKTIYTRFNAMIGTPAYLSPEQAEMSNVDIDTRSDIYSMGILLYELLTGSTPISGKRLEAVGFDEMRRIIREEDPPRPSARLSTLEGKVASTVAAARKLQPSKLAANVRNDLDWIVMKAIDKDRNRRYVSAAAMAEDVSRFLNNEPIEARPPSTWYQFNKLARRHKVAIVTSSIVAAAMIMGITISSWQAAVATRERDKKEVALQQALDAKVEANQARAQLEDFTDRLKLANKLLASGRANADAGRWEHARADIDKAIETQPSYYRVWMESGWLYVKLGLWGLAAADFSKALETGSPVDGPEWWGVAQLLWYAEQKQAFDVFQAAWIGPPVDPIGMDYRRNLVGPVSESVARQLAEKIDTEIQQERYSKQSSSRRSRQWRMEQSRSLGIGPPTGHRSRRSFRGRHRMPFGVKLYVSGWAHLKAGNYEVAIERLEQVGQDDNHWRGLGTHLPLLAMAYHQAGRGDDAINEFERATTFRNRLLDEAIDLSEPKPQIPWFEWMEFLINYRHASIIVKGHTPVTDSRFSELNSIAQELLSQENDQDSEK